MIATFSLGANLGDRAATMQRAVERIGMVLGGVRVSPWYATRPVGIEDQPPFLNLVLRGSSALPPDRLLALALGIERGLGRSREAGPRFGPRPIDIDLLLVGALQVERPGLIVPHPRMAERAFVLAPLRDLAPDLTLPGDDRRTVDDLWHALDARERSGVQRIAPPPPA